MRELLRFFLRHHFVILFLVLESLGFFILVQNNKYQKAKFVNFSHNLKGLVYKRTSNIRDYTSLREENRKLIEENNQLYNSLRDMHPIDDEDFDSALMKKYIYIQARVINNSTDKQYNYITLDKGRKDGVEKEMAVVCSDGILGVVKEVSQNFSSVISLLNLNLKVNAKIKKSGYFGPLQWSGVGYKKAILSDIPHHVDIQLGDTIVTSGYSAMFPEGYMIGIISDFRLKGGNYFEVIVDLSTDFKKLRNVQVIKYYLREEQLKLEKSALK
jgi:rod shape-determining protein MreC